MIDPWDPSAPAPCGLRLARPWRICPTCRSCERLWSCSQSSTHRHAVALALRGVGTPWRVAFAESREQGCYVRCCGHVVYGVFCRGESGRVLFRFQASDILRFWRFVSQYFGHQVVGDSSLRWLYCIHLKTKSNNIVALDDPPPPPPPPPRPPPLPPPPPAPPPPPPPPPKHHDQHQHQHQEYRDAYRFPMFPNHDQVRVRCPNFDGTCPSSR